MDLPPVLTAQQTADVLQCDVNKVYRLLTSGELPGRKVGGSWRILTQRLIEWMGR